MLWITLLMVISARANILTTEDEDKAPTNRFLYNELNIAHDHCRSPQKLNRETWTCECDPPLKKSRDECVCENCLFSTNEESYAEKNNNEMPEYLTPFLKNLDEEEERRVSEGSDDGGGIANRMFWVEKRPKKKMRPTARSETGKLPSKMKIDKILKWMIRLIDAIKENCREPMKVPKIVDGRRSLPRVVVTKKENSLIRLIQGLRVGKRKRPDNKSKMKLMKVDWDKARVLKLRKGYKGYPIIMRPGVHKPRKEGQRPGVAMHKPYLKHKPQQPMQERKKSVDQVDKIHYEMETPHTTIATTPLKPETFYTNPSETVAEQEIGSTYESDETSYGSTVTLPQEQEITTELPKTISQPVEKFQNPADSKYPYFQPKTPDRPVLEPATEPVQPKQKDLPESDASSGMTFSDTTITNKTDGAVESERDKAYGSVSNFYGTGSLSLGAGGGSAGAAAYTGEGLSQMGVESTGAKAYGVGMIGKKAYRGTSTTSLLIGEGDALATNSRGKTSSASATAVATKKVATAGSTAYGSASAAGSATPGKGKAGGSSSYGESLNVTAEVSPQEGPVAETVALGNENDNLEELIAKQKNQTANNDSAETTREKPKIIESVFGIENDVTDNDWLKK